MFRIRSTLLLCVFFILCGCSPNSQKLSSQNFNSLNGNDYLQLAASSAPPLRQQYLIQAASQFLKNQQIKQAIPILNSLASQNLPDDLLLSYQFLNANLLIKTKQYARSIDLLNKIEQNNTLTTAEQIRWLQFAAQSYAGNQQPLQSLNLRQSLGLLLQDNSSAYQNNLQQAWLTLQKLSSNKLTQLASSADTPYLSGWINLALTINNASSNPQQLRQNLTQWQNQYPNHAANSLLPSTEGKALINNQKIALLLPLSGQYSAVGKSIRNGFFAAYYYWKSKLPTPPAITVYDTSKGDINTTYAQAIKQGATLVIGPLTKPHIQNLIQNSQLNVATIALNTLEGSTPVPSNLFQFGLSPIDSADQLAIKAIREQHSRAIIITSDNSWGNNIANNIKQVWQQQGGTVVTQLDYNATTNLAKSIITALNLDKAKQRALNLRWLLHEKIRYTPRRRKDYDSIFLIATSRLAKQIQPLLKFYYNGDTPVYAISPIYAGTTNISRDRDLDGIEFCDIPWVLQKRGQLQPSYLQSIQQNIEQLWRTDYRRQPKLYALGVDAFDLSLQLNKMLLLPQLGTSAATGVLYLNKNHHIYRHLMWAKFKYGVARLIH